MRIQHTLLLLAAVALAGCASSQELNQTSSPARPVAELNKQTALTDKVEREQIAPAQVSLKQADQSQVIAAAMDRKIIRNAELNVEVNAPAEVQQKIGSIAESLGGFVVNSESKQHQTAEGKEQLEVSLVVRIPASQFDSAMTQIRATGNRVIAEKTTGEDVTEEFIDLEARLKTQIALEQQFLEIMKQAHKVEDALEVQRQIADVRTEIEKLEGRKRFLENRASLSTISITLSSPAAIVVNTSGFGRSVRDAVSESVEFAIAIVLFLIRFVILMIPIGLLIVLPLYFIGRLFYRRALKAKLLPINKPPAPSNAS